MRTSCLLALTALVLLPSVSPVAAQGGKPVPTAASPAGAADARAQAPKPADPSAPPEWTRERLSTTTGHVLRLDGQDVRYTVITGTLPLKNAEGKVTANVFSTAYLREGVTDVGRRPITFAYNGGPGSASIWLHLGSISPRRVVMAEGGFQPAPPFRLVANEHSLLDVTDMVFLDPVGTGFSRAVPGEDPKPFYGAIGDVQSVAEFIRTWLVRHDRWASPKYIFGESYGTMRSAGLSAELQQRHGIELNGIVLVSSVLDYLTKGYAPGNIMPYVVFLPTETAIAWYHKRLDPALQADLGKTLEEARVFARGEYATALLQGNRLSEPRRQEVAKKVARYTGLSPEFVMRANLRVSDGRFRKELLRDKRLVVGRLDGRFTALDADAAGELQEFDPANTSLQGAYTAMFHDYVARDLEWKSDRPYLTSGDVRPWDYRPYENRYLNMVENLRGAMARNPYLKVFVANGYYDMATPFFGTEYTFDHLGFDDTYRERVSMGYYQAGHMMYIDPAAHAALTSDLRNFYRSTLAPAAPAGAPR